MRAKGLSKNTVAWLAPLSVVLADAVDDGLIGFNPVLELGGKKRRRADSMTVDERLKRVRPLTTEQGGRLMAAAVRFEPRAAIYFFTLLRAGSPRRRARAAVDGPGPRHAGTAGRAHAERRPDRGAKDWREPRRRSKRPARPCAPEAPRGAQGLFPFLSGGHRQLALENLAFRQQLAVYKRTVPRPRLRRSDRLWWVCLARVWTGWRAALVDRAPDTVLRWQRRRVELALAGTS